MNQIENQDIQEIGFITFFEAIQREVNATAHSKGWYESELKTLIGKALPLGSSSPEDSYYKEVIKMGERAHAELQGIEDARRIALMHSELSEGLEGLRHGNPPSDHIPKFSAIEEELADCIIRIMDVSQERGWKVAEALIAKAAFNQTRTHKHGGKKF